MSDTTQSAQPTSSTAGELPAGSWTMFAGLDSTGSRYRSIGADPRTPRYNGVTDVHQVQVIEDPAGEYHGWLRTGDTVPTLIHSHARGLAMSFPAGPGPEEAAGRGRVLRLRIQPQHTPGP